MANPPPTTTPEQELADAARARREADLRLTMSQRLEELTALCKQLGEIAGAARPGE